MFHTVRTTLARIGFPSATAAAGACGAGTCAIGAIALGPLVLGGALAFALHWGMLLFAPLTAFLLHRNSRRHGQSAAVLLATAGTLFVFTHFLLHLHEGTAGDEPWMVAGALLLVAAAAADWISYRRVAPARQV
ncbi:MAG: hypothetical protein R3272_06435 [Candidatus Promineifilaceae bacterium]|nr:hypothetical protein [Candidatus Promineifilaceae bacterium]